MALYLSCFLILLLQLCSCHALCDFSDPCECNNQFYCNWCKDNKCHAVGSIYGCLKPQPCTHSKPCSQSQDCVEPCYMSAVCRRGRCLIQNKKPDNSPCDDGRNTTTDDRCFDGVCKGTTICPTAPLSSVFCNGQECLPSGQCRCDSRWEGEACAMPRCTPACVHGTCVAGRGARVTAPHTCVCEPGWTGDACDVERSFCDEFTQLSETSGKFSDGSGRQVYRERSLCMWHLTPPAGYDNVELTISHALLLPGRDMLQVYHVNHINNNSSKVNTNHNNKIQKNFGRGSSWQDVVRQHGVDVCAHELGCRVLTVTAASSPRLSFSPVSVRSTSHHGLLVVFQSFDRPQPPSSSSSSLSWPLECDVCGFNVTVRAIRAPTPQHACGITLHHHTRGDIAVTAQSDMDLTCSHLIAPLGVQGIVLEVSPFHLYSTGKWVLSVYDSTLPTDDARIALLINQETPTRVHTSANKPIMLVEPHSHPLTPHTPHIPPASSFASGVIANLQYRSFYDQFQCSGTRVLAQSVGVIGSVLPPPCQMMCSWLLLPPALSDCTAESDVTQTTVLRITSLRPSPHHTRLRIFDGVHHTAPLLLELSVLNSGSPVSVMSSSRAMLVTLTSSSCSAPHAAIDLEATFTSLPSVTATDADAGADAGADDMGSTISDLKDQPTMEEITPTPLPNVTHGAVPSPPRARFPCSQAALTGLSGTISDGSYPSDPYLPMLDCTWNIRPSNPNDSSPSAGLPSFDAHRLTAVVLLVLRFETLLATDHLLITDPALSPTDPAFLIGGGNFSGAGDNSHIEQGDEPTETATRRIFSPFVSSSAAMDIRFTTSLQTPASMHGWEFTWQAVDSSIQCARFSVMQRMEDSIVASIHPWYVAPHESRGLEGVDARVGVINHVICDWLIVPEASCSQLIPPSVATTRTIHLVLDHISLGSKASIKVYKGSNVDPENILEYLEGGDRLPIRVVKHHSLGDDRSASLLVRFESVATHEERISQPAPRFEMQYHVTTNLGTTESDQDSDHVTVNSKVVDSHAHKISNVLLYGVVTSLAMVLITTVRRMNRERRKVAGFTRM